MRLLSQSRPKKESENEGAPTVTYTSDDTRSAFERDYDRIIFSAAFRRLARKTQVHPLASNDHIHNRLTHSLEVASIGRAFARRLAKFAVRVSDLTEADETKLIWIIQSACLMHDLGNPPFGHAGEEVVRAWSRKHSSEMFERKRFGTEKEYEGCFADWLYFEGNAQGFRIAARSDNPEVSYLHLTHAAMGAAIKYPWTSIDTRARKKGKHNIYSTEITLFNEMAEDLGLRRGESISRHPLSFLTEAADDICYRIIDLEDAVEMGIYDRSNVNTLFEKIAGDLSRPGMKLPQLRGYAIQALMSKFWKVFEDNFDAIMNGEREDDLKSSLDSATQDQLEEIKESYDTIFGHSKKVALELGAYHVIGRILKALMKTIQAIDDADDISDVPFLSKRCAELVWGRDYAETNFNKSHAWWLACVNDFVSGMTDDYATRLSGDIGGHTFFNR